MGQKRMLWNMWRRYEVKTYTIMNASPVARKKVKQSFKFKININSALCYECYQ